jgi:xylan 1,4-beta-xylosidase
VLVWNYHDDDLPAAAAQVDLTIEGLPNGEPTLTHYRVDQVYSNSYEVWKRMGSPQQPTPAQYAELEEAGQLHTIAAPAHFRVNGGRAVIPFNLPRQGVSLVKLAW